MPAAYLGLAVALGAAVVAVLLMIADRNTVDDPATPVADQVGRGRSRAVGVVRILALLAVGILASITHPFSANDTPTPYDGVRSWWSFYGNNLNTTLTTTNPLDLSEAIHAQLTAKINYNTEEGYDLLTHFPYDLEI